MAKKWTAASHIICQCQGEALRSSGMTRNIYETSQEIFLLLRSKSFEEGGETFTLVVLVNDVGEDVTEGVDGDRHM